MQAVQPFHGLEPAIGELCAFLMFRYCPRGLKSEYGVPGSPESLGRVPRGETVHTARLAAERRVAVHRNAEQRRPRSNQMTRARTYP